MVKHLVLRLLPAVLLLSATTAAAVDLVTSAAVEIVEGISVVQTTQLNFGVLARNSGSVTVAAADGAVADPDHLVVDATAISQGIFDVASINGADVIADCTAGVMPAGITLSDFTVDWADAGAEAVVPATRTLAADDEVLEVGAMITIDETTVQLTGGTPVDLPYTLTVVFP